MLIDINSQEADLGHHSDKEDCREDNFDINFHNKIN
jgi:hypothetical protein